MAQGARSRVAAILVVAWGLGAGCASFHPQPLPPGNLRAGAETVVRDGVTVRAALLSPKASKRYFDTALASHRIQPIWIEIENRTPDALWFLPVGVDRGYYPALEAAARSHRRFAPQTNRRIDGFFRAQTLSVMHPAGTTNAGFVFARFTRGAKAFNVELVAPRQLLSFTFAQPVPGFKADFSRVPFDRLIAADDRRAVDEPTLRAELAALPATTTSAGEQKAGDPLNLVVVGSLETVLKCLVASGWNLTEPLGPASTWRTMKALVLGGGYATAPVSHLYAFGRKQDLALQKPRHALGQRNHLRLWLTPLEFQGQPVWLGQISRDTGIRLTPRSWHLSTHRIAPDVDESRDYLVADLLLSSALAKVGWVLGVGAASAGAPRHNLGGDPYYTDGLRVVLVLSARPVPVAQVERLRWEQPPRPELETFLNPDGP